MRFERLKSLSIVLAVRSLFPAGPRSSIGICALPEMHSNKPSGDNVFYSSWSSGSERRSDGEIEAFQLSILE